MSIFEKITNSPSRPIGRNLNFPDTSIKSHKKHYWAYGQGNLGFLTSQQIQMLKQMKKKQRNLSAVNHLRPSYNNITMSQASLNKQSKIHQNNQNGYGQNQKNDQMPSLKTKKKEKNANRQNKRFFSHSRQQSQSEKSSVQSNSNRKNPSSSKLLKKPNQETIKGSKKQIKRPINSRRIKTLQINKIYNPQGINYRENEETLNSQRQVVQKFRRKLKSKNDLHSKSVDVEVRPDFHSESKKNVKQQKSTSKLHLDSGYLTIEKDQINLKPVIKQHKENQICETPSAQPTQSLYKSKKFLSAKVHTRTKFRRDFSPTYCNSFGYPLSCYRYV